MSNLYLRFLRITRSDNKNKNIVNSIDTTAMLLLNEIAIQDFDGIRLNVSQVMTLKKIASPATIHRKLEELRNAGLIDQIFEGSNRRTKYLVPTKLAHAYFVKMSETMINAINY